MTKISEVNREQAELDPVREFSTPNEVTGNRLLTRAEKLTAPRSWAFDVQRRLDAAAEGMAPETVTTSQPGSITSDTELLRSIELEISFLENKNSESASRDDS